MRAWLYLIAAAIAGGIIATPALLLFVLGGSADDTLLGSLVVLMLVSGLAVVTMKDIIRCGLAMIVCFLALAGIYVILGAPMVAAAQVLVYTGAISVLILFAIMLTQSKAAPARLVFQTQAVPAAIASIILTVLISLAVIGTGWNDLDHRAKTGTEALAAVLFDQYVLPFEVVSVLLLAAVIGGVFLAKREDVREDAAI
ncbi:MAG TPA: NADH-quinone oxidoreductase subunit J [Candidatus Eisenbacteria bacterium]|nr:NADH-quinone oxidoreductase subunit J [Candidatus Eisenbacteria bacterium]